MKDRKSRLKLSLFAVILLPLIAIYAISQGDSVTPPICIGGVISIVNGYQISRAHTKGLSIKNNKTDQIIES